MIETSGEGGSAWLTPPLGGINSSLKERESVKGKVRIQSQSATNQWDTTAHTPSNIHYGNFNIYLYYD